LALSLAGASCRITAPSANGAPIVCITFDDGHQSVWEHALPVLQDHGFPATNFINSGRVGNPNLLTWDQVRSLEIGHGWETGGHTLDHEDLAQLSYEQAELAINLDLENLVAQGLDPRGFALPAGVCPAEYYDIITRQYDYIRSIVDMSMHQPLNRYALGYFPFHTGWTAGHLITRVKRGIANGEALIVLGFHTIGAEGGYNADCPVPEFARIIDYVGQTGLRVMTLSAALEELGALD